MEKMREVGIKKSLSIIFLILLLAAINYNTPQASNGSLNTQTEEKSRKYDLSEEAYIPHDKIVIYNDQMLIDYGFPGEGTASSPYIIQGLNITTISTCIVIFNTTKNIEISNCWLMSGDEYFLSRIVLC